MSHHLKVQLMKDRDETKSAWTTIWIKERGVSSNKCREAAAKDSNCLHGFSCASFASLLSSDVMEDASPAK